MCLDERVEPELRRRTEKLGDQRVVEVAQEQQHRVRAGGAKLGELGARREEALRQQRQLRGRAGRQQIRGRASEAGVHEHGDGRGSGALELVGQESGIRVGPQVACRGRAALDLGDRGQARAGECVA